MIRLIVGVSILLLSYSVCALPTAKYTLAVFDEEKKPIEGANASVSFMKSKPGAWGGRTYFVDGKTDSEGFFVGEGATERYGVYGADADGYYGTNFKYRGFTGVSGIIGFRKWQPWNPTFKVVLKRKINPIPMYAYDTEWIEIPEKNKLIGYDLIKHDWVFPYGKGVTKDFLFKVEGYYKDNLNFMFQLSLQFPTVTDGLQAFLTKSSQGSDLRSSHHAPLENYKETLTHKMSRGVEQAFNESYNKNGNYYFRVRCEEDKPETCLYGKIYGDIEFDAKGYVKFRYLLNPSKGDTNVEFDPARNLFKGLKTTPHSVDEP